MKKPIASMYSMSSMVEFEPYIDTTIDFFFKRLEEVQKSDSRHSCDLGAWLQWYAFDVMGEVTFSKRLGFLDEAKDVDGIIATIWKHFQFCSVVGQMPWLDYVWGRNKFVNRMLPAKMHPVIAFALAGAGERKQKPSALEGKNSRNEQNSRDFMSRFIEIQAKDPSIPESFVTAWAYSNVLAGSDTTAIMLRSIIYFLIRNPSSLRKLTAELTQARSEGRLSNIVTWAESRRLPYLDACVKEAGRLHPAIGLTMERVVPEGGAEICGKHFKAGTVVGMNPWVIHRSKEIFGSDVYEWNPDRWLGDETRRREMERCLLMFAMGHRTCIGKNLSYIEIYKLIPTLFARYDVSLSHFPAPKIN
ncbi:Cytochrome P450 monooxygenase [Lachnellula arida]|uniref:Cytochrome P450 monooxygenase n=1 Tax=Lachnellula arida TaxID=1316785 RepID=A0A8T9BS43_9HELO|nr:Cytochrome P450 monooxygenase [Lachnellula arida]